MGFGLRQSQFRDAFVEETATPGRVTYSEVDSFNQAGLETTIVGLVRLNRVLLNTSLDLFGDFEEFEKPTLDWRNTFSWRLTGSLSADYNLDVLRQPQVTDDTQLTQSLLFRLTWGS